MKLKKNKLLLIFAFIIIAITVARECGMLDLNQYNYAIKRKTEYSLKKNEVKLGVSKLGFHTKFNNENYLEKNITVDKEATKGENDDFNLIIKKESIPLSFVPFYTNVDYEIEVAIDDTVNITKTDSLNLYLLKNNVKGTITIKGNLKGYGLLSNYEIKKLITADYKETFKEEFKKYLVANP